MYKYRGLDMGKNNSIVRQLQEEAINPEISVSDLLRKAKLVSVKLDLKEFLEWINNELTGYMGKSQDVLPSYRIVSGAIMALNPYRGWIPVEFEDPKTARSLSRRAVAQPIAELEEIVKEKGSSTLFLSFSPEMKRKFMKAIDFEAEVSFKIGRSVIVGIIESVRNLILDWSLRLEKEGILGENLSFSKEEKEKALESKTIYNIGHIEKFSGSIGDVSGNSKVIISEIRIESIEEVGNIIKQIKQYLPQIDIEEEQKKKVEDSLCEIDKEMKAQTPSHTKVKKILASLKNIFEGAAGNVIAQGIIVGIDKIFR